MLRLTSGQWTKEDGQLVQEGYKLPRILYKSANFVVVDKRFDLKINSDDPAADPVTVATQLGTLYPEAVDKAAAHSFRFIHRLDYATSGCLCVALTKAASRWGNKAFARRYVTKHYVALVRGHLNAQSQRVVDIDIAIGRDMCDTEVHRMCVDPASYRQAPSNVLDYPSGTAKCQMANNATFHGPDPMTNCLAAANDTNTLSDCISAMADSRLTESNCQLAAINLQPATTDSQSATTDPDPATKGPYPATNPSIDLKPAATNSQCAAMHSKPVKAESQPAATDPMLAPIDLQPATTDPQPATTDLQPATTSCQPVDGPVCSLPREAKTRVVLLQHGTYDGRPVSKLLLIPHTGRTHQLRVHCLHIGHAVVGDYTYSNRTDTAPARMMLHALHLHIPMKRETVDVLAPDPLTPEVDHLWRPTQTFETYEGYLEREGL